MGIEQACHSHSAYGIFLLLLCVAFQWNSLLSSLMANFVFFSPFSVDDHDFQNYEHVHKFAFMWSRERRKRIYTLFLYFSFRMSMASGWRYILYILYHWILVSIFSQQYVWYHGCSQILTEWMNYIWINIDTKMRNALTFGVVGVTNIDLIAPHFTVCSCVCVCILIIFLYGPQFPMKDCWYSNKQND